MKKSLALIMSLIMIFFTFSVCTVSASAATVEPAAVVSTQEIKLENDFALTFKAMFRSLFNHFRESFGMINSLQVTEVAMKKTKVTVELNKPAQLSASVEPEGSKNKTLRWESEDPGIVSVTTTGVITGKSIGQTKIYAIAEDGGFYDVCTVSVIKGDPEPDDTPTTATVFVYICDEDTGLFKIISNSVTAGTYVSYAYVKTMVSDYINNSAEYQSVYDTDSIVVTQGGANTTAIAGKTYRYTVDITKHEGCGTVNVRMYTPNSGPVLKFSFELPAGTKTGAEFYENYLYETYGLDVIAEDYDAVISNGKEYEAVCSFIGDFKNHALVQVTLYGDAHAQTVRTLFLVYETGEQITAFDISERLSEQYNTEAITENINETAEGGKVYYITSYE